MAEPAEYLTGEQVDEALKRIELRDRLLVAALTWLTLIPEDVTHAHIRSYCRNILAITGSERPTVELEAMTKGMEQKVVAAMVKFKEEEAKKHAKKERR